MTTPEEWPWRVGTHYNIHVYAVHPDGNRDYDIPVGTFSAPELAAAAVYAHNRLLRLNMGHTDAEWQALGEALQRVHHNAAEEAVPQWEHARNCINDDCEGCQ